jgi:hypothetical protein
MDATRAARRRRWLPPLLLLTALLTWPAASWSG